MVRSWAAGSGASGATEPLAAAGTLLPSGVTNGVGRRAVAGRQHPGLVAPAAQGAGQPEHLALDPAGDREAVGAQQADAHDARKLGAGRSEGFVVTGPVGLEQVPLLRLGPDESLQLVGQHLGDALDVVAQPPSTFGGNRLPDRGVVALAPVVHGRGQQGRPGAQRQGGGPAGQGRALAEELDLDPAAVDVAVGRAGR